VPPIASASAVSFSASGKACAAVSSGSATTRTSVSAIGARGSRSVNSAQPSRFLARADTLAAKERVTGVADPSKFFLWCGQGPSGQAEPLGVNFDH
jgi:hypothetical protein